MSHKTDRNLRFTTALEIEQAIDKARAAIPPLQTRAEIVEDRLKLFVKKIACKGINPSEDDELHVASERRCVKYLRNRVARHENEIKALRERLACFNTEPMPFLPDRSIPQRA